jgi:hypothetical protein
MQAKHVVLLMQVWQKVMSAKLVQTEHLANASKA